eukprot:198404-Pyramimonas_sp.AAC.1
MHPTVTSLRPAMSVHPVMRPSGLLRTGVLRPADGPGRLGPGGLPGPIPFPSYRVQIIAFSRP